MASEVVRNSPEKVVQLIDTLRKQQEQAREDIKSLEESKEKALIDPGAFVQQLLSKRVPSLPHIDFSHFTVSVHDGGGFSDLSERSITSPVTTQPEETLSSPSIKKEPQDASEEERGTVREEEENRGENGVKKEFIPSGTKVRGRLVVGPKPASFNSLWTAEEQKRLEELLLEYPDEPVAAQRWKKIAAALGNRTPKQVASRTQKYFIRLAKEGKPVPGRVPNLEHYPSKKKRKRAKTMGKEWDRGDGSYYCPPVVEMSEDEEEGLEEWAAEFGDTPEFQELTHLLHLRASLLRLQTERVVDNCPSCLDCGGEAGWKCRDCSQEVLLCGGCLPTFHTETHLPDHHMDSLTSPEGEGEALPY